MTTSKAKRRDDRGGKAELRGWRRGVGQYGAWPRESGLTGRVKLGKTKILSEVTIMLCVGEGVGSPNKLCVFSFHGDAQKSLRFYAERTIIDMCFSE